MGRRSLGSLYAVMMDAADTSYHLAVDPAYQGRGLGKRLLDESLAGLRRIGVKRVIIMVADNNPSGREFWKRSGYEEIPGAVAMGIDLLVSD